MKAVANVFVSTDMDDNLAFRQEENLFNGDSFAPVIEFTTADGSIVEFTGGSSKPPRFQVGDKVNVWYQETYPEKAGIDSFFDKWFATVFLLSFSSITTLTGVLLLLLVS